MSVELLLVPLEGRGGVGVGKDVALDEIFTIRAAFETFSQAVCDLATLELMLGCLECSEAGTAVSKWSKPY